MTLNLRIAVNPKTMHNEIVMASCLVSPQYPADHAPPQPQFQSHFCILTRPTECPFPHDYNFTMGKNSNFKATTLHKVDSERALLSLLLTLLFRTDPDLLVGHDIANFDLPTLLHRLSVHKVENWSRIGKLKRSGTFQHQAGKTHHIRSAVCGRLVCDIKISSQELIRARSYDLDTLCQTILKMPEGERQVVAIEDLRSVYSSGASLRNLVCLSMQDAALILRILCELNAIPLALQITNIAGNVMSRTLMGGRSERNEFLLLHAFTERGYLPPDKVYGKKAAVEENEDGEDTGGGKKARRKKAAYSGGLVLDPKKGFYDNFILLMDFNSLYPSIIQEYNICFTTLVQQPKQTSKKEEDDDENDGMEELLASLAAAQAVPAGVLPTEIRKLVESRRVVKGILAKGNLPADEKMQLNIRQMALKLTANSMYGCLGFSNSRFYAKHLAALVTAKGREILMATKSLVERMGLDVVYGDTDSIMINTRSTSYDEVLKLGFKVKGEVNKQYHNVELEVDGIFKYLLLLKKKKYAALTISRLPDGSYRTDQELKGLDIVRRDWAPIASDTGRFVVNLVLADMSPDERLAQLHERLSSLRGQLERGDIPVNQLAVAKTLTRSPEQYTDKKGLPHVMVALRLNAKGGRKLKQGDTVHYIICIDGTTNAATQRAYHIDELKTNQELKIDVEYYLAHQIHPVVSRLIECLDGTDAVRIAECLGLDPTNYRQAIKREEDQEDGFKQISQFCLSEEERFKHCEKFKFKCQNSSCGTEIEMSSAFTPGEKTPIPTLEKCSNKECAACPADSLPYLQNCLSLAIRKCVARYYENWLVCEDPRCNARVRGIANNFHKDLPVCRKCKQGILLAEYSEHDLHQQIYFYRHIFNISKYPTLKRQVPSDVELAYLKLQEQADKVINLSAYCLIDLTNLFKKLQTKKSQSTKASSSNQH